jgi:hypothetical protein
VRGGSGWSGLPNQRLQLTLPPIGARPLAVLRGGAIMNGEIVVVAFVRMTPALRWAQLKRISVRLQALIASV